MTTFEVWMRVTPTRFFGLADPDVDIVPDGYSPKFNVDMNSGRSFITLPDDRPTERLEDERLQTDFLLNGMRVRFEDNIARVTLRADDEMEAVERAESNVQRLMQMLVTTLSGPGIAPSVEAFSIMKGSQARERRPDYGGRFYVYNTEAMGDALRSVATELDGISADSRLDLALGYFALGEDLLRLQPMHATDAQMRNLFPLRFLQFWKALTAIIGDPSRDPDHQSRPKRLGLGRHFYRQRVKPLHDLRNDFDVAHVADPHAAQIVDGADVANCRAAAVEAISAYVESLRIQD